MPPIPHQTPTKTLPQHLPPEPAPCTCTSPKKDGYRHKIKKRQGCKYISPLQDLNSPYYLTSRDHPGVQIISDKLTGEENYITWVNGMRISLVFRRKLPFINGKIKMSAKRESKEYDAWEIVNELVLAWILNCVSPEIASTLMHS